LTAAGLLVLAGPGRWEATNSGRVVLAQAPDRIDFDDLKQFDAYNDFWAEVRQGNRRRKLQELRFEYYASGRRLVFGGSFDAAAVLLGYSIEYHLKAALHEIEDSRTPKERNLVKSSHD
jgi:hypothetical protein